MYRMGKLAQTCKGKIIKSIKIDDNKLYIEFDDRILMLDDGQQSCCENRYMTCDDPLHYWEGLAFVGYYVADGPDIDDNSYEVHECQFLIVDTFLGSFTVANHNEHNGYYGGFNVGEELTHKVTGKVTRGEDI